MIEASREMLMLWEDVLPPATEDDITRAGKAIGEFMARERPPWRRE